MHQVKQELDADIPTQLLTYCVSPTVGGDRPSHIQSSDEYQRLYSWSIEDPTTFWSEMAKEFVWSQPVGTL